MQRVLALLQELGIGNVFQTNGAMIALLVLGLANCFLGRWIFRLSVCLIGLFGGALGTAFGMNAVLPAQHKVVLALSALAGVAALVLLVLFYKVAVIVAGAAVGVGIGWSFWAVTGVTWEPLILFGACAVGGGILALPLERTVVTLLTAFGGAGGAAAAVLVLAGYGLTLPKDPMADSAAAASAKLFGTPQYVAMGAAALVGIGGLFVQFWLAAGGAEDDDDDEKDEDD